MFLPDLYKLTNEYIIMLYIYWIIKNSVIVVIGFLTIGSGNKKIFL